MKKINFELAYFISFTIFGVISVLFKNNLTSILFLISTIVGLLIGFLSSTNIKLRIILTSLSLPLILVLICVVIGIPLFFKSLIVLFYYLVFIVYGIYRIFKKDKESKISQLSYSLLILFPLLKYVCHINIINMGFTSLLIVLLSMEYLKLNRDNDKYIIFVILFHLIPLLHF